MASENIMLQKLNIFLEDKDYFSCEDMYLYIGVDTSPNNK